MTPLIRAALLACALVVSTASLTEGQEVPPPVESLKIQFVFAKYQGDKKISSVTYELSVRTDGTKAQLRMGTMVPVPFKPDQPYTYKDVGTNIDCTAASAGDGLFKIDVSLEESSVSLDKTETGAPAGIPSFRSFRSTDTLLLRNGQSTQFTVATDKMTGERNTVDVSLVVSK